jgi:hypothetical protein
MNQRRVDANLHRLHYAGFQPLVLVNIPNQSTEPTGSDSLSQHEIKYHQISMGNEATCQSNLTATKHVALKPSCLGQGPFKRPCLRWR